MKEKTEILVDHFCELGEGPVWDRKERCIYWVDIIRGEILRYNTLTSKLEVLPVGKYVGAVSLCFNGGLLAALHQEFAFIRKENGEWQISYLPLAESDSTVRFNDGKCDLNGNFWAGTLSLQGESKKGNLYMLDQQLKISLKIPQVSVSNGLAWSEDGSTLYYIDTAERNVVAYDHDPETSSICNRREVIRVPEEMGKPDGMTIDAEGLLWIALWKGWKVTRWNPATGECVHSIPLPVSQVTSCTFGGSNLDELYITSARIGLTEAELEEEPLAGAMLVIRNTGIKGNGASEYKGSLQELKPWQPL